MKKYVNDISLSSLFGNIVRKKHVLVSLRTEKGEYILSGKRTFYPKGIYRLMGGGVCENETYLDAAIREIQEESSLVVDTTMLKPLFEVETRGIYKGKTYTNTTVVFEHTIKDIDSLHPGDDVTSFVILDIQKMKELIYRYHHFTDDEWYVEKDYKHAWKDYGKMYGYIHELLLNH